jgi:single-stranded DNA-binding protein
MTIECAFIGSLTRDAAVKLKQDGKSYLQLNIAVGNPPTYISALAFNSTVDAKDLTTGTRIYCEGKIQLTTWQAKDGTMKSGLSCICSHLRISAIGKNRPKPAQPPTARDIAAKSPQAPLNSADLPFEV